MSELTPKARELVSAGKGALRPSDADRERIFQSLQGRIGPASIGSGDPSGPLKGASVKGWGWVAMGVVGAGLVGTILMTGASPDAAPAPSAPVPGLKHSATPFALEPMPEMREPSPPAPEPSPIAPPSARRAPDRLAEEVAILARAAADLRAGRAADALSALNEHQGKFPKGALTQERRAARAEALCALGRVREARSELARLPKSSPQAVRAAAVCDKRTVN